MVAAVHGEFIMERNNTAELELIDLGIASIETKGAHTKNDDGAGRQAMGISED